VLEVITDSVNVVLANLGLLAIPLVIDIFYVAGRELSISPVVERVSGRLERASFSGSDRLSTWASDAAGTDLTGLFALVLPTMFGSVNSGAGYDPIKQSELTIGNAMVALVAIVAIVLLAAVTYGLFGAWLSDVGLNRTRSWEDRLRALPAISARIAGVFGLGIGIAILLCLPMLLAWGATSIAGLDLKGLFLPLIVIVSTALLVLFFFAPEAIFVAGASPAQALRLSAAIVRRNGWATLGFIGATTLISWGLSDVWERLATNPPGLMLAMAGSAFAGTSLALASMLYFNGRWLSLDQEIAPTVLTEGQKPDA